MNNLRKLSSSKLENDVSPESYESCNSEHEVIEIMTSDLDSEALKLLSPSIIQKKLRHLANSHTKNGYQAVKGISHNHTKELSSGTRVQIIHDSLSSKCLKWRGLNTGRGTVFEGNKGRGQQIARTCDAKIMSEKFADAVFERILPHIPSEDLSSSTIPTITPLHLYVEKKVEDLDQRFHRLETAVNEVAEFVAHESPNSGDLLPNVIQNANISLGKLISTNQVLHPHFPSLAERRIALPFEPNGVGHATSKPYQDRMSDEKSPDKGAFQTWPSLWNHLKLQKINFWRSLIDNQYIPSAPNEITYQQSSHQIPGQVNSNEVIEILKESKKGETLRRRQNSV